jgi:hypothetical protein
MPREKKVWPPNHTFKDIGSPIATRDYQPRKVKKDPERILASIFGKLGCDYGGPIDALDALANRLEAM